MSDLRLFVAINFSDAVRSRIADAVAPLREAGYPVRWVRPELVHLTLKFLGDVDPDKVDGVGSALGETVPRSRAFVLPVGGAGAFPTARKPRIIWVGCEGVPALELLQHEIERAMSDVGFPIEGRAFRPHLTVGRVRRDASPVAFAGLEADLAAVKIAEDPLIEAVDLMESQLGPGGPKYTRRLSASLGAI